MTHVGSRSAFDVFFFSPVQKEKRTCIHLISSLPLVASLSSISRMENATYCCSPSALRCFFFPFVFLFRRSASITGATYIFSDRSWRVCELLRQQALILAIIFFSHFLSVSLTAQTQSFFFLTHRPVHCRSTTVLYTYSPVLVRRCTTAIEAPRPSTYPDFHRCLGDAIDVDTALLWV